MRYSDFIYSLHRFLIEKYYPSNELRYQILATRIENFNKKKLFEISNDIELDCTLRRCIFESLTPSFARKEFLTVIAERFLQDIEIFIKKYIDTKTNKFFTRGILVELLSDRLEDATIESLIYCPTSSCIESFISIVEEYNLLEC
jgi:hypothetical protein